MKNFKKIEAEKLQDNVFQLIGKEWMLITGGTTDNFNTMTASWGSFGILWHKQIATCFIRPQRHTFKYLQENDYFTLCFFEEKYRDILNYCGKYSGRDKNKAQETGLIPMKINELATGFEQSRLIIVCKKIYVDDIKPENFSDTSLTKNYPAKDYHRMFIGEIMEVWSE